MSEQTIPQQRIALQAKSLDVAEQILDKVSEALLKEEVDRIELTNLTAAWNIVQSNISYL